MNAKVEILNLNSWSADILSELIDAARIALTAKSFKPGDKVAWIGKGGMVCQGEIERSLSTGTVLIKRKGEYQAGTALPPEKLYKSYEAACSALARMAA